MKKLLAHWDWLSRRSFWLAGVMLVATSTVVAQKNSQDLTLSSLEELMRLEVISASKKEEKLFTTATAVYVITREEIRRSGLTSVAELLRLVPGVQVARIDGSKYAISARGFNGRFANMLLVMVDGRSVYSPETAGVYWEAQDLPIDEIERIEVIRGPGGTMWGANAVNGVINIITRDAEASQGFRMVTGGGSQELGVGSVRLGGKLSDKSFFKIYAQYNRRDGLGLPDYQTANNWQRNARGGFRLDWQRSPTTSLSIQGEVYGTTMRETSIGASFLPPFVVPANTLGEFNGGFGMVRWQRKTASGANNTFKVYFDRSRRETIETGERFDTLDFDWQQQRSLTHAQNLIWGFGYRHIADQTSGNPLSLSEFIPSSRRQQIFSGFGQHDYSIVKDRLRITLGAKVEHNTYSAYEFQPNARLLFTPNDRHVIWLAASKAVRTPMRVFREMRVNFSTLMTPQGIPALITISGSPNFHTSVVHSYEAGYRTQVVNKVSFDAASFYSVYKGVVSMDLRPAILGNPQIGTYIEIPLVFGNSVNGETYGTELAVNADLHRHWQLRGSYSFMRMQLHAFGNSLRTEAESPEGINPRHQFQLHSYLNLPRNFEFDASLYHVSALTGLPVPRYTRLDLRLGWRWRNGLEFSLAGQNLLDKQHPEISGQSLFMTSREVRRGVFGKLTWNR